MELASVLRTAHEFHMGRKSGCFARNPADADNLRDVRNPASADSVVSERSGQGARRIDAPLVPQTSCRPQPKYTRTDCASL